MFERFTEKAIKVIMLAQEEARRLGHNFVGAEFIFLGLIGEATGVAAKVLRQQGITLKNARIEVEKILGRGSGTITVELPFTESAKLVFNGAWSISEQLGSEFIDTEHLLIGIFQEGESIGKVLQNLRVNPQNLALSLSQYFQHQPSNQLPQNVDVQEYQEFLSEVLQAVYESTRDSTVVYPILQRRQHLLDDTFAQLLQQWARNVFSQENAEDVATIALVIQLLCIEIAQFPLGSRANNLEIAITGYQTLLEVYTRDAFPNEWATSQKTSP
jgi:ATP-dependent Clp protease ATP-binding subunit ClpA